MSAESRLHSDLLLEKFKVKLKYNSNIYNFAALKDFNHIKPIVWFHDCLSIFLL